MNKRTKKYWHEQITVEIQMPQEPQPRQLVVRSENVWLEGNRWMYLYAWPYDGKKLLISGDFEIFAVGGSCTTRHIRAARTFDNLKESKEKYAVTVVAAV